MTSSRLYHELARKLATAICASHYLVGTRLPAERDLAARYGVAALWNPDRAAMRTHLAAVIEALQLAIEEGAVEEDRRAVRLRGERFRRPTA